MLLLVALIICLFWQFNYFLCFSSFPWFVLLQRSERCAQQSHYWIGASRTSSWEEDFERLSLGQHLSCR